MFPKASLPSFICVASLAPLLPLLAVEQALLRGSLRKAFGMFDLLCLGLGIVIGSGWGQLSGAAAELYAG